MKLSGHEKSLADAGQRGHAIAAVVDRAGCSLREASDLVMAHLAQPKHRRRLERVYWVLKRGDRYASTGATRLGMIVGWTHDRALADEFGSSSDAFDERSEDMKTLDFKVVRVTVWRKR